MKDFQQKSSVVSTPERGGGSILIEQKRYMSANEMYSRLLQSGYLADLRARANNSTDHNVFLQEREKLFAMVDNGQCPRRPSMMEKMDIENVRRDVQKKIDIEVSKSRKAAKEAQIAKQKADFEAAVAAEVEKRTNPKASGGQSEP